MSSEYGSHIQTHTERQIQSEKKHLVRECIETGNKHISRSNYDDLYTILKQGLMPILPIDTHNIDRYYTKADENELDFYWSSTYQFLTNPSQYNPKSTNPNLNRERRKHKLNSFKSEQKEILEEVFSTFETVAGIEGYIRLDVNEWIPVYEFGYKIGERRVPALTDGPGEQHLLEDSDYPKSTLFGGSTGTGKSTAQETIVMARYRNGNKIIDVHDTEEAENILWDVPNDIEDLEEVREELSMPNWYTDNSPKVEVLVPLSKNIEDTKLPQKVETDDCIYRFFSVPASELSKKALQLMVDQTDAQKKYVSDAYDKLEKDDWTLSDLSQKVSDTGARADVVKRIQKSLSTLQDQGYIRDKEDEYTLDWESIFSDTDTITCVTTMFIEEDSESLLMTVYVLNKIFEERKRMKRQHILSDDMATLTLVIREISQLAPTNTKSGRDGEVQKFATEKLKTIFARHRHYRMDIIADAQNLGRQLNEDIRSLAHRIFQFAGFREVVKESFRSRVKVDDPIIDKVSQYNAGTCALIDEDGYSMPIKMSPPPCRHFDTKIDISGWSVRTKILDDEELQEVDVDASVPEDLQFSVGDEEDEDADTPEETFAHKCLDADPDGFVFTPEIWDAYTTWMMTTRGGFDIGKDQLMRVVRAVYNLDDNDKSRRKCPEKGKRKHGYAGISLTEYGRDYTTNE